MVPVSPNAIKTWRDGEVLSGAKSDAGDAAVIAEYLRLRPHRLRPWHPYSAETKALRTVVRTRDDLVDMRVAATNQLAALLDAHWPGAKAIFADVESPIAWRSCPATRPRPPPRTWASKRLAGVLAPSTATPAAAQPRELLARLRHAPAGTTDPTLTEAVRDAVLALVAVLEPSTARSRTSTGPWPPTSGSTRTARSSRRCQGRVRSTPPRCSPSGAMSAQPTTAPTPSPPSPASPRSPRTPAKHRAVHFRWACNKRFRVAITTFADNSRHASPWAADIYARARARGNDHPHAVRVLARAWIRVIYRCWSNSTPYDPTRHGGRSTSSPLAA